MLKEYKAIAGQSVYDVCTLLYGNCNNIVKLCADSGLTDIDTVDLSGFTFIYDTSLVANNALQSFLLANDRGTNYITPDAACPIIAGLSQTGSTTSDITATWSAYGAATGYQYALTGSDSAPTTGWVTTTDVTVTIGGLASGTTYFFWIRAICGPGSFSAGVNISVATDVAELTLWTSPWLDPDVVNPSPGIFMEYFIPPVSIYTGFALATIPSIIIRTELEEDAYLVYLNSGFEPLLNGTFARASGVFSYIGGLSESPSLFGDAVALYKKMKATFTVDVSLDLPTGYRYTGSGVSKQGLNWGDGTDLEYYTSSDTSTHLVTHTVMHDISGAPVEFEMFHNDNFALLQYIENGIVYPSDSHILGVTGLIPNKIISMGFLSCSELATASNILEVDISMCPIIEVFQAISCPLVQSLNVFNDPNNAIRYVTINQCNLDSAATDAAINDFVANTWNGTLTGGVISILNSPAAPPTATSLASRNLLTTASWTQSYNP